MASPVRSGGCGCSSPSSLTLANSASASLLAAHRAQQPAEPVVRVGRLGSRRIASRKWPSAPAASPLAARTMPRSRCARRSLGSSLRACRRCSGGLRLVRRASRIAQVGQRLRVLRLIGQLRLELAARIVVALLLPVDVAQTEVDLGLAGPGFRRGFELRGGLLGLVGCVEHLAQQHVDGRGVRVLGEQEAELGDGLRILLRPHVALGQLESQFGVVGLLGGGELQVGGGGVELAASVVAHAEEHAGLKAGRVGLGGAFEGGSGGGEAVQLEVGQAEVEVDAGEVEDRGRWPPYSAGWRARICLRGRGPGPGRPRRRLSGSVAAAEGRRRPAARRGPCLGTSAETAA